MSVVALFGGVLRAPQRDPAERPVTRAGRAWLAVILLASALLPIGSDPASAVANHKLSTELAGGAGDVTGASRFVDNPFRFSPDSRRVIYLADQETDDVFELYSVLVAGGAPVRLNGPLVAGGDVSGAAPTVNRPFLISPDGVRVIYLADQETDGAFELYSVPIAGGVSVKLNPTLAGGAGSVRGTDPTLDTPFAISPDSARVVYVADQETDDVFELYSVPIAGGVSVKLNPTLAGGAGDIGRGAAPPFAISPDSARVVYVADQETDDVFELYSVPIAGGVSIKLNPTLAGGQGDIRTELAGGFAIAPNSTRVVYAADQHSPQVNELYSVPIRGGHSVRLNGGLIAGGNVAGTAPEVERPFSISPDSQRVVYLADQERDEVYELYSVPIAGGTPVKLNSTLAGGRGDVRGADRRVKNPFRISPDSRRVVYVADQERDEVYELYIVPIAGGRATRLNGGLAGGRGDVRGATSAMPNPFLISPDSRHVIYVGDQETDSVFEIFSVPIAGGASVKLNPTLAGGKGEVRGADNMVANPFRITDDSAWVIYEADQESVGVMELYCVPITGGRTTKLNATLDRDRGTIMGADYETNNPFRVSPDGQWVAYIADQEVNERYELYASRVHGMHVLGRDHDIAGGDASAKRWNGSDFGVVDVAAGGLSQAFTIENTGQAVITLGANAVTLSGPASADFRVIAQPATRLAAGAHTTFTLRFEPQAAGERAAMVQIATDQDQRPYRFAVLGTGMGKR